MRRRVVIDTDIGTDVDDLWTLAMVPGMPDVHLDAVTVVYGDTDLRARLAATALRLMGLAVPVHCGVEATLSGKAIMWAGHEGVGVPGIDDATYDSTDAVDALIELAAQAPGTLELVAIAPLTNIATAIERDPTFATNLRHLYVMGAEFAVGWPEHNVASDVVAARTVLDSGARITLVPLDQTVRVPIDEHDIERIAAAHPIGPLMAEQARTFWRFLSGLGAGLPGDRSWAHDPLTLLAVTEPGLFTTAPMRVTIEDDGRAQREPDAGSTVRVVTDVDAGAAHEAVMRSLGCA